MKSHLRAGLVATSVLSLGGCSELNPQEPLPATPAFSVIEQSSISWAFDNTAAYWQGRAPVGVKAVQLVLLDGSKQARCPTGLYHQTLRATDDSDMSYCPTTNDIILSQAGIKRLERAAGRNGLSANEMYEFVIGHEFGHAVQEAAGSLALSKDAELQADCYAGQAMRSYARRDAHDVADSLGQFMDIVEAGNDIHGTGAERQQAYIHGASGQKC